MIVRVACDRDREISVLYMFLSLQNLENVLSIWRQIRNRDICDLRLDRRVASKIAGRPHIDICQQAFA